MLNKQNLRTQTSDSYSVVTGIGIQSEFSHFIRNLDAKRAFFVIDGNVMDKQAAFVSSIQEIFEQHHTLIIPPGEQSKNLEEWSRINDFCLEHEISRNTPLVAVGGGVIGDLAGFAASTVLRGVPLIHIPTTLLAMVDSAIGGKTGINHRTGKNLIGTFYQPSAVFSDLNTLSTLPDEEFICGFGEILKYGAIVDTAILEILKTKDISEIREQQSQLESIMQRCIKIKADIVSRDTKETGDRAFLNYGHTFAHALEKRLGYGTISHGQAVYIGMIAAGFLSLACGGSINMDILNVHCKSMNLNASHLQVSASDLIRDMQSDKKKKSSQLRFVLLQKYGRPYLKEIEDIQLIEQAWNQAVAQIEKILNN